MKTPAELIARMEELLAALQTNHREARAAAAEEAIHACHELCGLARKNTAMVAEYCGYYELHVTRLARASRGVDGNHIDLLGAMTEIQKLRGFAGFDLL